jgi:hypothetical protein
VICDRENEDVLAEFGAAVRPFDGSAQDLANVIRDRSATKAAAVFEGRNLDAFTKTNAASVAAVVKALSNERRAPS